MNTKEISRQIDKNIGNPEKNMVVLLLLLYQAFTIKERLNNKLKLDKDALTTVFRELIEITEEYNRIKNIVKKVSVIDVMPQLLSITDKNKMEINENEKTVALAFENYFYGLKLSLNEHCQKRYHTIYDSYEHPCFKGIPKKKTFRELYHISSDLSRSLEEYINSFDNNGVTINSKLTNKKNAEILTHSIRLHDLIPEINHNILQEWEKYLYRKNKRK